MGDHDHLRALCCRGDKAGERRQQVRKQARLGLVQHHEGGRPRQRFVEVTGPVTIASEAFRFVETFNGLEVIPKAGTVIEIGRAPSELLSLMRISYAVFCLKKKEKNTTLY